MSSPAFKSSEGFTLIELLIVLGIVGVLASIAIPQFAAYKQKAVDANMHSALHSARQAMEGYFVEFETYVGADTVANLPEYGFRASSDVSVNILTQTITGYSLCSGGTGGTSPAFSFDSSVGVMAPAGSCP